MRIRTYSELITLSTFKERFQYLKLSGILGEETFGFDRWLNQKFYMSPEWKAVRKEVLLRDNGCDLGLEGHSIMFQAHIHHMNPISIDDLKRKNLDVLLNPEFLITTSFATHNNIHYGSVEWEGPFIVERFMHDTSPWRR